jgi:hypothetical protein
MQNLARISGGSGLSATVISAEPIQGGTVKVVLRFRYIYMYIYVYPSIYLSIYIHIYMYVGIHIYIGATKKKESLMGFDIVSIFFTRRVTLGVSRGCR